MSTPLVLSTYKPNFADPRVKARVRAVLDFCKPMLFQKKARKISSKDLTKTFGNQRNDLSARLRYKLLQQEGTYAPGKHSFSYSLKRDGYEELAAAIDYTVPSDADTARELYGSIASGAEVPKYSKPPSGWRRYSGFQNLPKAMRAVVFKGWFDYDIEAAAPTLVYQLACRIHRQLYPAKTGTPYPSVLQLIEQKAEVRQHVAELTGLEFSAVKTLLAALFFQAPLAAHHMRATYRIVGFDADVIDRLKADPFVTAFKRDVSAMWAAVLTDDTVNKGRSLLRQGKVVPNAASKSKQRMAVYARLERQAMDVMESVLAADGKVPLLMHDGFMVRTRVDANRLVSAVLEQTGFRIKLSESQIGLSEQSIKEAEEDDEDVLELLDDD
jgi:hypothetical protein